MICHTVKLRIVYITKTSTKIYQKIVELVFLCIFSYNFPAGICLARVHNKITETSCEIC